MWLPICYSMLSYFYAVYIRWYVFLNPFKLDLIINLSTYLSCLVKKFVRSELIKLFYFIKSKLCLKRITLIKPSQSILHAYQQFKFTFSSNWSYGSEYCSKFVKIW